MSFASNWRELIFILLVMLSVLFIHPFSQTGLKIAYLEDPATQVLQKGDLLRAINGNPIATLEDFQTAVSEIEPDDTVAVSVLRETFPYSYLQTSHSYIAGERGNETWISLTVVDASSTNLDFSHELAGGRRYVISAEGDPEETVSTLSKRFSIGRVSSYSFERSNGEIYLYTQSGEEIFPLINSEGVFEAKIGEATFFDGSEVIRICTSGISCSVTLFPYINQTQEGQQAVWQFGFDASITDEASTRFADLTSGLSIAKCEGDSCTLNQTIDYYLDGELIGSEEIFADSKGKPYRIPHVTGTRITKQDAEQALYQTQAILQGQLNAEVVRTENVPPSFGPDFLTYVFLTLFGLILIGSMVIAAQTRSILLTGTAILVGFAELTFVLGWLAVLNLLITSLTIAGLVTMAIFTSAYKIYVISRLKKEGISQFTLNKLGSRTGKVSWLLLGVFLATTFVFSQLAAPLVIYFIALVFLSKALFFKRIRSAT
jgi:hypothetical protein